MTLSHYVPDITRWPEEFLLERLLGADWPDSRLHVNRTQTLHHSLSDDYPCARAKHSNDTEIAAESCRQSSLDGAITDDTASDERLPVEMSAEIGSRISIYRPDGSADVS